MFQRIPNGLKNIQYLMVNAKSLLHMDTQAYGWQKSTTEVVAAQQLRLVSFDTGSCGHVAIQS